MSTFTAINLDKEELDFEEHTRELQIEMCLKLYDNALRLQKEKKFRESSSVYDQLFKIDVIKNDINATSNATASNNNNSSNSAIMNPTIENLKYLVYRNRGFLRLNQLIAMTQKQKNAALRSLDQTEHDKRDEHDEDDEVISISSSQESEDATHPKQRAFDLLVSAIEDMISSLQHGKGDYKTIQVLFKFFKFYDFKKLSRFALEYEILNKASEDISNSILVNEDSSVNTLKLNKNNLEKGESKYHTKIPLPSEITIFLEYYETLVHMNDSPILEGDLGLKKKYDYYKAIYDSTTHLSDSQLSGEIDLNDLITPKEFEDIVNAEREDEEDSKHFEIEMRYKELMPSVRRMKWSDLLENLNDILPKHQKKTRIYDSYILSETPIEKLTFTFKKLNGGFNGEAELIPDTDPIDTTKKSEKEIGEDEEKAVSQQDNDQEQDDDKSKEKDESSDSDSNRIERAPRRNLRNTSSRVDSSVQTVTTVSDDFFQENLKFVSSLANFLKLSLPSKDLDHQEALMKSVLQYLLESANNINSETEMAKKINTRSTSQLTIITRFLKSLSNWKRSLSESLLIDIQNEDINSSNSAISVREILYSSDLDQQPLLTSSLDSINESEYSITTLDSLMHQLENKNYHFTEIRMKVLESLLGTKSSPLFITYKLDRSSLSNLKKILDACDISLYKRYNAVYLNSEYGESNSKDAIFTSITVLEVLIDSFISMRQERKLKLKTKLTSKSSGNAHNAGSSGSLSANIANSVNLLMGGNTLGNNVQMNDMIIAEDILLKRIDRWMDLVNNYLQDLQDGEELSSIEHMDYNVILARFTWSQISLNQHKSDFDSNFILRKLRFLSDLFESSMMKIDLPMNNLEHILSLSVNNVNSQLLKIKIFAKFSDNISNINSTTSNSNILEKLLLPHPDRSSRRLKAKAHVDVNDDESEMDQFIHKSSFELKLRLWQILLNQYFVENLYKEYRVGFEIVLKMLYEATSECFEIETDTHVDDEEDEANKRSEQKYLKFFRLIGFYGSFVENYLKLIQSNNWDISPIQFESKKASGEFMKYILYFFNIFYSFMSHEDIAESENSSLNLFSSISPKSHAKFKQFTLATGTLLCIYYEKSTDTTSPDIVNDFISIIHEQLGIRNCCDQINGIFLDFIQWRLIALNWDEADKDFFQCIYCKYGIQVSIGSFSPFDHGCKHVDAGSASMTATAATSAGSSTSLVGSSTASVSSTDPITTTTSSGSVTNAISKKDALVISKFVLPYMFKTRNPITNTPKADMKTLVDSIYEAVGDITYIQNETLAKNKAIIESYLTTNHLTLRTMKFAFYGLIELDGPFDKPDVDVSEIAESGLYYLQGLTALTLYKTRKKNIQGRMVELDYILKMLMTDLTLGSNRYETWVLLGQTFSLLVEDDIIWTSDKLTNEEKKINTALIQRKSLLSYLMAINLYSRMDDNRKRSNSQINSQLWTYFGKELYSSLLEPMSKLAFSVNFMPLFMKRNGIKAFEKISEVSVYKQQQSTIDPNVPFSLNPLNSPAYVSQKDPADSKDKTMYKILRVCFQLAISLNPSDWLNYYYLSKVESKLHSSPESIIDPLLESCTIALKSSNKDDPIIEPHYRLCSSVFKLVRSKSLEISDAVAFLNKNSILRSVDHDLASGSLTKVLKTEDEFYEYVITALKKVCSYDKKNWHHKPHYRIAKIYFEQFNDVEMAKKEMSSIINLKSSVRNLSTIWKPDAERPGKHFVYNYEYIVFYIELLASSRDIHQLFIVTRKLRRFGSSMIHLLRAWEYAVSICCTLMKQITGMFGNYLDREILKLLYPKFVQYSDKFITYLESRDEFTDDEKIVFLFMNEASELRRMANGFGTTSAIDECYHSLYLKLFLRYCDEILGDPAIAQNIEVPAVKMDTPQMSGSPGTPQPSVAFVTGSTPPPVPVKQATPSREKLKVARRDITPYCVKTLKTVSNVLEEITKNAGDGIILPYEFPEDPSEKQLESPLKLDDSSTKTSQENDESPLKEKVGLGDKSTRSTEIQSLLSSLSNSRANENGRSLKDKIQEIFSNDNDDYSDRAASLQPIEELPERSESSVVVIVADDDNENMNGEIEETTPTPVQPPSIEAKPDVEMADVDSPVTVPTGGPEPLDTLESVLDTAPEVESDKSVELIEANGNEEPEGESHEDDKETTGSQEISEVEESETSATSKPGKKRLTPNTPKKQTQSKITSFFVPSPVHASPSETTHSSTSQSPLDGEATEVDAITDERKHKVYPSEILISPPQFNRKRPVTYSKRNNRPALRMSKRQKTNDLIVIEEDDDQRDVVEKEEEDKVEEDKVKEDKAKNDKPSKREATPGTNGEEDEEEDEADFVDAIESLSQDPKINESSATPKELKATETKQDVEVIELDSGEESEEVVEELPKRRSTRNSTRNK